MTIQPGAMLYTQGFGSRPEGVEVPHIDQRAPNSTDVNYPVGKRWIDQVAGSEYALTSITTTNGISVANWGFLGSSSGDLNSLTTDDATVVLPTAGTIVLSGNSGQGVSTSGSNGPGTATVTVADWTTAQKGVGVLATNAQAIAGVGTTEAVTPAALQAKIGTETAHGVAMGNTGPTSALSYSAAGTAGQAFISGGAGADGAYGVLTVPGGGTGAATLTGIVTGNGTSAMTANTVTEHGVLIGGASNAASSLAVAATGTILTGVTGADPAFTATPSGLTSITATSFITSSATVGTTFTNNSLTPTGSDANIDLLVNGKGTGGVIQSRGLVGGDITIEATNTDNTNVASRAGFEATVGGTSAGDPYFQSLISGGQVFSWGIDNSTANDDWVLSKSATLGTSNQLSIDGTSGALTTAAGITATTGDIVSTAGAVNAGTTMTAGTGITATTGDIVATAGAVNAGTSMTATLGAITATNGNLVLGTAGNKILSTSVGTTTTAGDNSFGSVTLAGGTATVATTAVTASSLIVTWRQSIGATGAAALGHISVGTITASTSFVINALQAADATALQASDVSVIGWMIIN